MLCSIKDANWQKFEIECITPAQVSSMQTIIQQSNALHTQMPITRIRLTNETFRIDFANGKIWRMKFLTMEENPDVSYNLDQNTAWKRDFIAGYITPLANTLTALRFGYGITEMDGIIL